MTGTEDKNGEYKCEPCGESQPGETAQQALERVATAFYHTPRMKRVQVGYTRIGPHDVPTELLPAVFVGKRGFFVATRWNKETKQHEYA